MYTIKTNNINIHNPHKTIIIIIIDVYDLVVINEKPKLKGNPRYKTKEKEKENNGKREHKITVYNRYVAHTAHRNRITINLMDKI